MGNQHDSAHNGRKSVAALEQELTQLRQSADSLRDENDELIEAQALLEEAKQDYAEISDLAPVPLLTLTAAGVIRSVNLAAAELLGRECSQLVGRLFVTLCAEPERGRFRTLLSTRDGSQRRAMHVDLLLPDGRALPVELRLRQSLRKSGVLHLTLLDATQREREEREKEELRLASKSKDEFIAMLSHELRTPLTPALAIASKMTREPELQSELRRSFEVIERSLATEARLIDDLLDATGIARGKVRVERQRVDVHGLIEQSVLAALPDSQAKRVQLEFLPDASASLAEVDPLRLRQVLANLLGNALKFTPAGGQVQVRTWNGPGSLVVEVSDTGMGFPPSEGPRLFAAFEQLERASRPGSELGLGLGLAICKGLVELHGGKITATSAGVGQGARFTVELPVLPASSQPAPQASAEVQMVPTRISRSGAVRKHCVLLIEDHQDTAEVMTELFQELGYEVTHAASCAEALKVDLKNVDAIVSDLGLPDGSGLELLPKLRETRDVPALALSGYGRTEDIQAARLAGFERHLTKPVDFPQLIAALNSLLGLARAPSAAG